MTLGPKQLQVLRLLHAHRLKRFRSSARMPDEEAGGGADHDAGHDKSPFEGFQDLAPRGEVTTENESGKAES